VSAPVAAVAAAVASALVLGISAVADQRSTKRVQTRRALSPRILADLVRQPLWLTAVGANIVGFALQVVALDLGSLALVQPILVCDLIFAVLILSFLRRRANQKPANRTLLLAGVLATAAGVAGFLAIGQPSAGRMQARLGIVPPLAIGLVVVVGGCLAVAARKRNLRPLALALACGVCYGVAAFLIKLLTAEFGGGLAEVFSNWPIYVLAVVGPAGYILNQDAFQQGTLLAPVQAIITAADPVISIALGVGWLDVRLRSSPADVAGEVLSFLLLIVGIVMTAYRVRSDAP
jgi:glucose uptake protein GlcU